MSAQLSIISLPSHRSLPSALLISMLVGMSTIGCSSSNEGAPNEPAAQPFATMTSDSGRLHVEFRSAPQPLEQGENKLWLTIHDHETHAPSDGLAFTVEPWMPAHDHGSSTVPVVIAEGNGKYLVDNVVFTMPGEWELRIHITSPFDDALAPTVTIR